MITQGCRAGIYATGQCVSKFLLFLTTDCGKNLFVLVSKINIVNSTTLDVETPLYGGLNLADFRKSAIFLTADNFSHLNFGIISGRVDSAAVWQRLAGLPDSVADSAKSLPRNIFDRLGSAAESGKPGR